jgi:hypothetical protein
MDDERRDEDRVRVDDPVREPAEGFHDNEVLAVPPVAVAGVMGPMAGAAAVLALGSDPDRGDDEVPQEAKDPDPMAER